MSENDKKEKKQQAAVKRGELVMGAVGNFAKAVAAGLEKEGERRSGRGLSGAGFAAAFSSGIEGLTDYTDMLQGNAAPGTVLIDEAMKSVENENKDLESKGVGSLQVDEVDEVDEQEGEFPDLLARPVETEEADVVPNTIRQAIEEGTVELPERTQGADVPYAFQAGPPRPTYFSFNMLESVKRYNPQTFDQVVAMISDFGPGKVGPYDQGYTKPVSLLSPGVRVQITEEEAMRRKEVSRSDPDTLPEAKQPTGVGDTAYRSVVGVGGGPYKPGQSAGGRAIPAN